MMALSQPRMSCLLHGRLAFIFEELLKFKEIKIKKRNLALRTRAGSKSHGRDPPACPGHWLPSNRLSSQLSGWGPLVRAVRAVLVVAVEALGGQQEEDLARGGDPQGEQHSAVALSTVSHFFPRAFVYPLITHHQTHKDSKLSFSAGIK